MGTGTITPTLTLAIENSYGEMDNIKVRIEDKASNASTDRYDAAKWSNVNFDVYSIAADGNKLAIDARGNDVSTIALGIKTGIAANDLTFKVKAIEGLENRVIMLRDKLQNTETLLQQVGDSYEFAITADTLTKGNNRFELVFSAAKTQTAVDVAASAVGIQISPNPVTDQLTINLGKEAVSQTATTSVRILTADGQQVQSQQAGVGATSIKVQLSNSSKGLLMVEVKNDKVNSVQKVIRN
jgi:hypothetical protein